MKIDVPIVQINISQIENGFCITSNNNVQVIPRNFRVAQQQEQGPQPAVTYCNDYEEVCRHLRSIWPLEIVDIPEPDKKTEKAS